MAQTLEQTVSQFDPLLESLIGGQPIHRAAIWGQPLQESAFNPAAQETPGKSTGGEGLWQDTADRRRAMEAFAQKLGKPWTDTETQVRYTASELAPGGIRAHAWEQICKTTTIEAATETAMGLFEAPANWQQEIQKPGSTTANLPRRLAGAKRALVVIMAAQSGAKPMADTPIPTPVPTPAPAAPSQTAQQLDTVLRQGETLGNQVLVSRLPTAAPIVQLVENAIVNPFLPTLENAFATKIDSNAAAHAAVNAIFSLLIAGLGFLAGKVTSPKV